MPDIEKRFDAMADSAPIEVFRPSTAAESAEIIRAASADNLALVPVGGATALHTGNRLRATRWAFLSTERLKGEIEFSPADMVVTAAAGTSLAAVEAEVEKSGQFLPIDHPSPESATLGGIVASNAQGLLRGAYGLPRDRLLGVRVILADGSEIKGGGKVVKNVAGYDLNKLFAGSWGTLGLITEVTFKTNPRPESTSHSTYQAESAEQAALGALAVYEARLDPIYTIVTSRPQPALSIGLTGSPELIEWQDSAIRTIMEAHRIGPGEQRSADELRRMFEDSDRLCARYCVRPTDIPHILRDLGERGGVSAWAQVSVGVIDVELEDTTPTAEAISRFKPPPAGHLIWTRVPSSWRPFIQDVWGPPRPDIALMRGIKQALDPKGIFSPGRFVGGI